MPDISLANLDLNICPTTSLKNTGTGNNECQNSQLAKPKINMLNITIDNISANNLAMQNST